MFNLANGPNEQIIARSEVLIKKCYFRLKSLDFSPSTNVNFGYKCIAVRGLDLLAKKLHKNCHNRLSAFKDILYTIYLKFNVVDKIQADLEKLKRSLIQLDMEKIQKGVFTRNKKFPCQKKAIYGFLRRFNRNF